MRRRLLALGLVLLAAPAWAQSDRCRPLKPQAGIVVLTGLTLWDGAGGAARTGTTVVIKGELIEDIFADGARPIPAGARVHHLQGKYAIPGLVDAHVHLATDPSAEDTRARTERRLCRALLGGVTSVRDMAGDVRELSSLQRDALVGDIVSPDIYYSALWAGPAFFSDPRTAAATAGERPGAQPWMRAVDSTTDIRQAVAEARGTGATAIKLYADLSAGLVRAIAGEAHRQGLPVWAHAALGPVTPRQVVESGVDVVSHASLLLRELDRADREALAAAGGDPGVYLASPRFDTLFNEMASRGTLYEPTLFVYRGGSRAGTYAAAAAVTRRAAGAGVRIVAGTDSLGSADAGAWAAPNIHVELASLVHDAGLTPAEALEAATLAGAQALRLEARIGTIEPGKLANLVLLARDPLQRIEHSKSIVAVMKRGSLYAVPARAR